MASAYAEMNVVKLKDLLRSRNLRITGNKSELIDVLVKDDISRTSISASVQSESEKASNASVIDANSVQNYEESAEARMTALYDAGLTAILPLRSGRVDSDPNNKMYAALAAVPFYAARERLDFSSIALLLTHITPYDLLDLGVRLGVAESDAEEEVLSYLTTITELSEFWQARVMSDFYIASPSDSAIEAMGWKQYSHLVYAQRWVAVKKDLSAMYRVSFPTPDDAERLIKSEDYEIVAVVLRNRWSGYGLVTELQFVEILNEITVSTTRSLPQTPGITNRRTIDLITHALSVSDDPSEGQRFSMFSIASQKTYQLQ